MRVYFIFDIKDEFVNLYNGNERALFNILRQIYLMNNYEVEYGYNLFNQLINRVNKSDLDRYIYLKFHQSIPYSKRGDIHIYNNLYRDEISRLTVKKTYIRLESEQVISSFFSILNIYNKNYFVCEFKYQECFFLSSKCNVSKT